MYKQTIFWSFLFFTFNIQASDEISYIPTPTISQVADQFDQDSDGVINERDLCPDTPQFAEIDNDGCGSLVEKEDSYVIRILFNNDSDIINSIYDQQIKGMVNFLKQYSNTAIEIQGYASNVGNHQYNMTLSTRRAKQVRNKIINLGIKESRIRIVGFGDTQLSSIGIDEISHALNRKVTATVVGHKGEVKEEWNIFTTLPKAH
ncbi:OmpA family protein [Vibrio splendidus]|jgi:OmpA-OmpF porin, OOP family|uniref:Outer membrane protein, OmpA/MotB n=2 Tax=Vibrio TaxID=662 RepID=A0A822MUV0_9VIBR|nr:MULTISPECIES: OmpA family protein [Vibrio]MCC4861461.1 OmpA family protein [Vibrio splendidus]MDH5923539.1 OmpA family protein [Vibrio splendidus]MDH5950632.1 OmpA family protein [Vibrio crassostreae]PTP87306.1 OmpA family protein [Vibrio splendidus]PTQ16289.1 OmpA family protein [Vibrio splendidus]